MANFFAKFPKISHKVRMSESKDDALSPELPSIDDKLEAANGVMASSPVEAGDRPIDAAVDAAVDPQTELSPATSTPEAVRPPENVDLTTWDNQSDQSDQSDQKLDNDVAATMLSSESENPENNQPQTEEQTNPAEEKSTANQIRKWAVVLKPLLTTKDGKPRYRTVSFWVYTVGAIAVTGGVGTAGFGLWYLNSTLPDVSEVFSFVRDGTVTIKAADGTILQQLGPATREKLDIEKIPQLQIDAFIASEDRRFYQHNGIDYQGIFRAMFSNLKAGGVVQGASTITQQLARVVFLTQEQTVWRKLREALLSWKLEKHISKQDILESYLNNVYLGSGAYGVADAAWVYFSKSVDQLTLPEMALIAGLPPAPSVYSPLVNQDLSKERRNLVLDSMAELGFITPEKASQAKAEPLAIKASSPKRLYVEAPYFTSYIQKELPKYISSEALELGGLTVETTVNPKWQKIAEQTIRETVEIDGYAQGFEQAAFVAIEPVTGEIKAMVGGRSFKESEFNRVTQAQRQPGSTFKGLVYTAAIAAGFYPTDGYEDANFTVDGYKPKNYDGKYRGWITMRDALTSSTNVVAVKVLMEVGFEPTIKLANAMGIKSKLEPIYSLALGGSEVNLLELTSAYGTLAAEGKYIPPHGIVRVRDRRGEVIYEPKFAPKQAVDRDSAAIVTWMLESVVNAGTGGPAQLRDRPVAGKTGTSDEARDLWFIGYIPQLVAGVWLGNDDSYPTWGSSGTAAFTWGEFMNKVREDIPVANFPEVPSWEGREPTIKAQPVQPNSVIYGDTTPDNAQKVENVSVTNDYEYPQGYE